VTLKLATRRLSECRLRVNSTSSRLATACPESPQLRKREREASTDPFGVSQFSRGLGYAMQMTLAHYRKFSLHFTLTSAATEPTHDDPTRRLLLRAASPYN
jgi:hypothetical protein